MAFKKPLFTPKLGVGWFLGGAPFGRNRKIFRKGDIGGGGGEVPPQIVFSAPLVNSLALQTGIGPVTYSRISDATVTDFEGLLKTSIANESRFSGARRVHNITGGDISTTAYWTNKTGDFANPANYTSGVADPNGGNDGVTFNYTSANTVSLWEVPGVTDAGRFITNSIWLRIDTALTSGDQIFLDRGTSAGARAVIANSSTPVGVWRRYSNTQGLNVTSSGVVGIAVTGGVGNLVNFTVANIQYEYTEGQANQNPSENVTVDQGVDHGSNVVSVKYFTTQNGNTVASNIVTEAVGPPISDAVLEGVLIEQASTNHCLFSEDLNNASWVASNITKSSDGITLPNGLPGASETLTASAANGTLLQAITLANNTDNFSVYLQRKTGSGNIDITLDNGLTWTTVALSGAGIWDRVDVTGLVTNPTVGVRIVSSGDAIQMWGAQVEIGTFPTSYISTTSIAVTRNRDSCSFPNSNILDDKGTLAFSFTPDGNTSQYATGLDRALIGVRGVNNDLIYIESSVTSGRTAVTDGTNTTSITAMPPLVSGTTVKLAARWSSELNEIKIGQDATEASASFTGSMNKSAPITVGFSGSERAGGAFKLLIIYNGSVDDATFTGLTT